MGCTGQYSMEKGLWCRDSPKKLEQNLGGFFPVMQFETLRMQHTLLALPTVEGLHLGQMDIKRSIFKWRTYRRIMYEAANRLQSIGKVCRLIKSIYMLDFRCTHPLSISRIHSKRNRSVSRPVSKLVLKIILIDFLIQSVGNLIPEQNRFSDFTCLTMSDFKM